MKATGERWESRRWRENGGPRKDEWSLWGEEKPSYRCNFLLAENEEL